MPAPPLWAAGSRRIDDVVEGLTVQVMVSLTRRADAGRTSPWLGRDAISAFCVGGSPVIQGDDRTRSSLHLER